MSTSLSYIMLNLIIFPLAIQVNRVWYMLVLDQRFYPITVIPHPAPYVLFVFNLPLIIYILIRNSVCKAQAQVDGEIYINIH